MRGVSDNYRYYLSRSITKYILRKEVCILAHLFSQVPRTEIPRSRFNRTHTYKTTCGAGKLIPFFWDTVLPSDSFNVRTTIFARMSTLISPIMDDLWIDTHYFFVPARLVWSNFQKFMGEQEDPDSSIDYVEPQLFAQGSAGNAYSVEAESLCDYMGLPLGSLYGYQKNNVSALPFRAVGLCWNEWFRDENLQNSLKINKTDTVGAWTGSINTGATGVYTVQKAGMLLPRAKRHDYFTSALPWPAKPIGDSASITVPLGGTANVYGNGKSFALTDGSVNTGIFRNNDGVIDEEVSVYNVNVGTTVGSSESAIAKNKALGVPVKGTGVESGLVADLTSATGITVNQLRQSIQIQRFLERSARTGTRYTEIIRGMFGCISPDARLQRPEYLGGSSSRIQVNVVPQTSASQDGVSPQANLAAFATGINGRGDGFTKSFTEHGFVIGFMSIRGPLIYQQGINRMFSKKTRFDYYWPVFAHLGEQAILNKEIYAQGTSDDDEVFGYQERYAEYRYFPSLVTGKFRSTYAQPLDSWHLAQKFDSLPTLSGQFIEENPPLDRVVSVPSEPHFLVDINIQMDCARPMPLYGVPGLVDHF